MGDEEERDYLLPQDITAERAILSSMLLSGDAVARATEALTGQEFYFPAHRHVFASIQNLCVKGKPVDLVGVKFDLERHSHLDEVGGEEFLLSLWDGAASSANIAAYIEVVKNRHIRRSVIEAASRIVREGYDPTIETLDLLNRAGAAIMGIEISKNTTGAVELATVVRRLLDRIATARDHPGLLGLATGYHDLDTHIGGFMLGEFIILAARPSIGKTTLACNMAQRIARRGVPVGILSLEASADQIAMTMLSAVSHTDGRKVLSGCASKDVTDTLLTQDGPALYDLPIVLDDNTMTITDLIMRLRRYQHRYHFGVVFIDYLQLIAPAHHERNREQEVAQVSRLLKTTAKDLHIPIVVLSQLNRQPEQRKDKQPSLADIRDSGMVEADADVVLLLHRPDYYDPNDHPGLLQIHVAKNRYGPTGLVDLSFIKSENRIESCHYQIGE
jgi:replicative DNA helicase